ncbi:uncharacterized protein N7469_010255 [Penicillium citrinum]|uniref:Uncharacterized protein n=2 Tax=Penicillium TaxID=5073 RepID=A0A9W9NKE2_PENCI|nr:uncharacterized protein N7469_010255 [Penicillium citrinum]KAJ5221368.1 hypothetical protein N7469_010255 [Penicillium citrinum]KAJ5596335.1 hypothetical protein N7450_002793 [Penicillium hetheringtonii]
MPTIQSLAIFAGMAGLSIIASADIITGGLHGNACPSDWTNIQYKDIQRCCYGSLNLDGNDPYCCVHDFTSGFDTSGAISDVKSDCFPFCTQTKRGLPTITKDSSNACKTKVAFTTDGYSSLVSAASASVTGTATKNSDSDATTTSRGDRTTGTATTKSSETSTNIAGPIATAEGLALGGAAIVAAFFVL